MNSNDTYVVVTIHTTAPNPTLVDSHADDTRLDAVLHRELRHPADLIAHLDEKQHALAFEMRDHVVTCASTC